MTLILTLTSSEQCSSCHLSNVAHVILSLCHIVTYHFVCQTLSALKVGKTVLFLLFLLAQTVAVPRTVGRPESVANFPKAPSKAPLERPPRKAPSKGPLERPSRKPLRSAKAMPGPAEKRLDFLVYGATGFTGRIVARELASQLGPTSSWAIGGRSAARLGPLAASIVSAYPSAPAPVAIVADAEGDTREALAAAFGRAAVVINCAGPFATLGRPVVRACIDAGVDYVDISGEPSFILGVMLDEDARARESGSLVVSACGFDSIPAEIGCQLTAAALEEGVGRGPAHIESFMRICADGAKIGGHATTLECMLMGFRTAEKTRRIRRGLEMRHNLPKRENQPRVEKGVFQDRRAGGPTSTAPMYCTLFPGSDSTIVRETIRAVDSGVADVESKYKFDSYAAYIVIGGVWNVLLLTVFGAALFLVSKLGGDSFIMRYPHLFTNYAFSRDGPSEADRAATTVTLTFYGKRYVDNEIKSEAATRVSIVDPGYTATSRMVVACARTILDERELLVKGGVLAPGTVFPGTGLVQRLTQTNALKLEMLEQK